MLLQLFAVVLDQFLDEPLLRRGWERHHLGADWLRRWIFVGCCQFAPSFGFDRFAQTLDAELRMQLLHVRRRSS